MDRITLDKNNQRILWQRNIFLFFAVLSLIAIILLASLLFLKKERIVVVPTTGPSMWIEQGMVSDVYLERFGSYLADLLLTRTPADVDRKNKILLEYVHPSFYHEAKKLLSQDRENIIKFDQSLLFRPMRSYINPTKQTYVIEGELLVFVGKVGESPSCAQIEKKKYTFAFQCHAGKLYLTSLKRETT